MISIHIPKGKEGPNLKQEISSATRIKDRQTRITTLEGLNKIAHYL